MEVIRLSDAQTAPPSPLDPERAQALFEHIYGLMNEWDVRHIPTVFTEDIEFQDDGWPEAMRGHAEVERFLTALWRAMPDLRFELRRIKRERVTLNMNDVGVQMGAAPAPGSRGERLAVAIQRLTARRMRRRVKS
jgi:SnoaL-like domain